MSSTEIVGTVLGVLVVVAVGVIFRQFLAKLWLSIGEFLRSLSPVKRWLRIRNRYPRTIDGFFTVVLTAVIVVILEQVGIGIDQLRGHVLIAVGALFFSYVVISTVTNLVVGSLIPNYQLLLVKAQGPDEPMALKFMNSRMAEIARQYDEMKSVHGAVLDLEDLKAWFEDAFLLGDGYYDGTDSHLPSEYMRIYGSYLPAHAAMLKNHKGLGGSNSRTLFGDADAIRLDHRKRWDEGYKDFVEWHQKHEVQLLHLDKRTAEEGAAQVFRAVRQSNGRNGKNGAAVLKLPSLDLGLWPGKYCFVFRPEDEKNKVRLWLAYPRTNWYKQAELLIARFKGSEGEGAAAMPLAAAIPEIFNEALCNKWDEFVSPKKRLEILGPFLRHVLQPLGMEAHILDAAAGIGCDGIWLAEQGYEVTFNEVEPEYRAIIKRSFEAGLGEGRRLGALRLRDHDWRDLYDKCARSFDAVMVLGNSLCLLRQPDEQRNAVENFWRILRPGGLLIIDERNFDRFMGPDSIQAISRNPIKNFQCKDTVMYCGHTIRGVPGSFAEGDPWFWYYSNTGDFDSSMRVPDELNDSQWDRLVRKRVGYLRLYPFKKGELAGMLEDCRFENITVYGDLDWNQPRPFVSGDDSWFFETADFLTYVAVKPDEPST